jgi:hypothetical protein
MPEIRKSFVVFFFRVFHGRLSVLGTGLDRIAT